MEQNNLEEKIEDFCTSADQPLGKMSETEMLAKIMNIQVLLEKGGDVPLAVFERMPMEVRRQCISSLRAVYIQAIKVG